MYTPARKMENTALVLELARKRGPARSRVLQNRLLRHSVQAMTAVRHSCLPLSTTVAAPATKKASNKSNEKSVAPAPPPVVSVVSAPGKPAVSVPKEATSSVDLTPRPVSSLTGKAPPFLYSPPASLPQHQQKISPSMRRTAIQAAQGVREGKIRDLSPDAKEGFLKYCGIVDPEPLSPEYFMNLFEEAQDTGEALHKFGREPTSDDFLGMSSVAYQKLHELGGPPPVEQRPPSAKKKKERPPSRSPFEDPFFKDRWSLGN